MADDEPDIILDLSRLVSRVLHPTPTGVDRCEMAYARGLIAAVPAKRLKFAAVHPGGIHGRLPGAAVERFLDLTERRWEHHGYRSMWERRRFAAGAWAALRPRMAPPGRRRGCYVQASPNNLTRPALIRTILERENARFVCLLHDLIPLQFPEYARPEGAAQHLERVRTMAGFASGLVANSHATLAAIQPWLADVPRPPLTAVAHLGLYHDLAPTDPAPAPTAPYFVVIGTIEPRKNHLLLLNLWRRMREARGRDVTPRLIVIGRRGWENEQIVDMLDRCPALRDCVEEHSGLPDGEMRRLLSGARALLMPSFAEGYGMPVMEAVAAGVPVICSDIPALREAGGAVPVYLDPLDGPAWQSTIDAAAASDAFALDQARRRAGWSPPRWSDHIAILMDLIHRVQQ